MFKTWKTRAVAARMKSLSAGLFALLGVVLFAATPASAAPAATSTTLAMTAGGNPVTTVASGTVVTLTATVLAGATPVTPGKVNFCNATAAYCEDIHLLGAAQLTTAGTAVLRFIPGIGNHTYKAVFVGTSSDASSASGSFPLTVTGAGLTTTTISSSGSAGNYTLTGNLSAFGIPAPTGQISFENQTNSNKVAATATLDGATLASGFAPIQSYITGNNPYSIAVADFNGDGIRDLAMPNEVDGTVSVLLGNGDGTFAAAKSYTVGNSPHSVAVGDFNSDGVPDLVVANYSDNTVSILLGNGDGTFSTQTTFAAGSLPSAVAVGDFNNDGVLDLAVADYSGGPGSVSILLGNGNGTFQSAKSSPVGNSPYGLAVADFNGDGLLDVVTANYGSNNVSVLLGNGDGTFQPQSTYAVATGGSNAYGVAVGDFNKDGSPDIAVASSGGVSVLINTGTGLFDPAVGYTAGNTAYAIAVGDFNLDGNPDLAVANVYGSNLSVLLGNGDGTFGSASNSAAGGTPQAVAVGDFNGDGRPDLAAAVSGSTNFAGVLLGELTESATATGVSALGLGTQNVFASYSSDADYDSSFSSAIALDGSGTSTTVTVGATPNPVPYGQTPSIVATLTPSNATGIGSANFTAFLDGTTVLTVTAIPGNQFQITSAALSTMSVGPHTIQVNFEGTADYLASSGNVSLQVNQDIPTLTWSPPSAIAYGTALGAILNASAMNGTVTVPGSYAYTATPSGGSASVVTSTTVLGAGAYTLAVTFTPTNATGYQSVSASVPLIVGKASPTVTLVSSQIFVLVTNAVTFTATISSTVSPPSGSINFLDGQTLLASVPLTQGVATYTTSSLAIGGHSITAAYSGDSNFVGVISSPLLETVEDFTLSILIPVGQVQPPTVLPGNTISFAIQAAPTLGSSFPSAVAFSASGLPAGATAAFTPQKLAAGASSTTVTLAIHLANQILSSNPAHPLGRGLALAMIGGMLLLPFGGKMRRSAGRAGRFAGLLLLMLAATGAALGLAGCAGSSGYFGQQQRNYTVTVTATSGALSHTTTVNFIVE
ncbi:MAG TPA: FG-GAP-like repeat-containing protein [Terriglobia bacterium]|nr:FG-GAP-like repeat-containing protein [Terriglobia bacterium]